MARFRFSLPPPIYSPSCTAGSQPTTARRLLLLRGAPISAAKSTAPGVMHYVHTLEVGYAAHELVFGGLFLAIVAIPLRRRECWAWWAYWIVLAADITCALTFGLHSATILRQSLIATVGLPVLLALLTPSVFRHRAT